MKINDRVRIRKTGDGGVIGDMCDDIVFVDLDNGVEVELSISSLILESEYETPHERKEREENEGKEQRIKDSQEVLDTIAESIVNLGRLTHAEAAVLIVAIGGSSGTWESANAYQKLNFVAIATNIPTDVWIQALKDGELGKLQLTALAMIGKTFRDNV